MGRTAKVAATLPDTGGEAIEEMRALFAVIGA
jgi:hypothetical protein